MVNTFARMNLGRLFGIAISSQFPLPPPVLWGATPPVDVIENVTDDDGLGKGRITCGDCGQKRMEEINLIKRGANYGWNNREGTLRYCFRCKEGIKSNPPTEPIYAFKRAPTNRAIIGGVFYRGCGLSHMGGSYVYGHFGDGKIFRLMETDFGKWENEEIHVCEPGVCTGNLSSTYAKWILSFGLDEEGEIYLLSTNNPGVRANEGHLYRLVDPSISREDLSKCKATKHWIKPYRETETVNINEVNANTSIKEATSQVSDKHEEFGTFLPTNGNTVQKNDFDISADLHSQSSAPKTKLDSTLEMIAGSDQQKIPVSGPFQKSMPYERADQLEDTEVLDDTSTHSTQFLLTSAKETSTSIPADTENPFSRFRNILKETICLYISKNFQELSYLFCD